MRTIYNNVNFTVRYCQLHWVRLECRGAMIDRNMLKIETQQDIIIFFAQIWRYQLDVTGLHKQPDNIEPFCNVTALTNVVRLQSFLESTNYY